MRRAGEEKEKEGEALTTCEFQYNSALRGGAMSLDGGVVIELCDISFNHANESGGALRVTGSTLLIDSIHLVFVLSVTFILFLSYIPHA